MQQHDSNAVRSLTFHDVLAREDWQNQTITHLNRLAAHPRLPAGDRSTTPGTTAPPTASACSTAVAILLVPSPFAVDSRWIERDLETSRCTPCPLTGRWKATTHRSYQRPLSHRDDATAGPGREPDRPVLAERHAGVKLAGRWPDADYFDGVNSAFHLWCNGVWVGYPRIAGRRLLST